MITGQTQLIGIFATPIRHSLSPKMHNTSFKKLGLDYVYLAFEVGQDGLEDAVKGAKALGMRGFNVSMPNKQAIIPYLDELSSTARLIGAVNTVVNENGRLIGHITDGSGAMRSLTQEGVGIKDKVITIVGAGGAGYAIAIQAALDGVKHIYLFNRTLKKAAKLACIIEKIGVKVDYFSLEDEENYANSIGKSDIFINATNIGMKPNEEESVINNPKYIHPNLVVFDAVYNPRQTKLLKFAQENVALKTIDGVGMLLYQGADAFKLWTGREMPIEDVKVSLNFK